ncbi:C-C motif chemokine 20 isoform X1 [Sarcophilus harrisii]|uniref:C-C motif chemokine 20 isoform X1 n=1 Tax=Sarcophilus harrisii TaxID=9305 RepID=UPI000226F44C|nr:C-C motif chemokine 20 isoform X1 [Sarcophilus harrisii]
MIHRPQRISAQSGKMNQLGSKILMLAPLIIVLLLCHFDKSQAASSFDCCLQYTERPVHVKLIKSYGEQWSYEACDIDAIIFYTRRFIVCANPKEGWVKQNLRVLRARNKKMSKSN